MAALIQLVHPFPSVLDGLVVGGTALLAGGGAVDAVRLGASMTALQFAVGALNDLVDAPADLHHVPPKPIPSGLVTATEARNVAAIAALVGLVAAAPGGPALVGLALVVLAIGAIYDLVAKGTPWSWVPFAVGIPILPVYGWFGATGQLHPGFAALIPMAMLAGAALAIANARADVDTDRAAGTRSVATALESRWSWWADALLMTGATVIGYIAAAGARPEPAWLAVTCGSCAVAAALGLGASVHASTRRWSWTMQAVGAALAGIGWVGVLLV